MTLPKPYYDKDGITIYNADCRDILPLLEPGSVDLVLTDPPYGCGKADWDALFPLQWYGQCRRLGVMIVIITGSAGLKDSVHLVGEDFVDVIAARNLNGMTRSPIGFGNWLAAVVALGKPRRGPNAFDFVIRGDKPRHPSPKPIEYILKLVERISSPGQVILHPFLGSGTTTRASKNLGRCCIGIEVNEEYCQLAIERLGAQGVLL